MSLFLRASYVSLIVLFFSQQWVSGDYFPPCFAAVDQRQKQSLRKDSQVHPISECTLRQELQWDAQVSL